ncbi:hypothetical protein [Priestia flexa]|uniref:hypothetical protein n=1 Tax=Priestia flexa TaxID=86664 RepID=UPI002892241B|nr:hypothetical protein [Priestia flexa]MDT2046526.1 hypothetical protein [Priestia flexa]
MFQFQLTVISHIDVQFADQSSIKKEIVPDERFYIITKKEVVGSGQNEVKISILDDNNNARYRNYY